MTADEALLKPKYNPIGDVITELSVQRGMLLRGIKPQSNTSMEKTQRLQSSLVTILQALPWFL